MARRNGNDMEPDGLLETTFYGGTPLDWVIALGVTAIVVLLVMVAKPIVVRRLAAVAGRTQTGLDDAATHAIQATQIGLVAVLAFSLATQNIELVPKLAKATQVAATLAFFLQVGLWLNSMLACWIKRSQAHTAATHAGAATSLAAVGFVGRLLVWAVVVLLVLDNLGINITTLVAGLGIGGVAVALAVQNILGDLFASLSIVLDKPFVIGDFIIVDDHMGTVEHIGLKTTRLRSIDGEQIIFSNSDLLKGRVRNYKRMFERRVVFKFGVTYDTTPDQLESIPPLVERLVKVHKNVRFERSHFFRLGDSALEFETIFWVTTPDYKVYMDIQQALNLALMREFAKHRIELAFPTRTIQVDGPVKLEATIRSDLNGGDDAAEAVHERAPRREGRPSQKM